METLQKETLIAQNTLIAQFMEVTPRLISRDCYGLDNMPFWSITGDTPDKVLKNASILLKYHNDWNQLMKVVEKIESNEFIKVLFYQNGCKIIKLRECPSDENYFEISINSFTKIEAVYEAVIEFIKWHNLKK